MPKVYLIGGAPRVGKTNLAIACIEKKPMLAASTDAIRHTIRQLTDKSENPDLFDSGKYRTNNPEIRPFLVENMDKIISQQNNESTVVWESVLNLIWSNLDDGFDVLIEGIAVTPEKVKLLNFDYSAIFLGNRSEVHFQTMLDSARSNQYDWLHNKDAESIKASYLFNQAYSVYIKSEAEKHNLTYIEISDDNFAKNMLEARDKLLDSTSKL